LILVLFVNFEHWPLHITKQLQHSILYILFTFKYLFSFMNKFQLRIYDNKYASIIDIYFYEYFLYPQPLSACASNI